MAGREVGRGEEGGDGRAAGERLDVVVVEIGAVVDGGRIHLDREPRAGPGPELVAVHAEAESRVPARREHRA